MKAAQITEYGDPSVININDITKPSAQPGQVIIEVHAASLNPFDTAVRAGYMQQMIPLHFPATLGGDIAGIVTELGEGVTAVAIGDKIYGQAGIVAGGSGAFAEYTATATNHIAKAPEGITFNEAASLPLVGVSALQGLTEHIKLTKGQKVLITGGSGGIGTIAIQLAKHFGAYVATTATGDGIALVKQLGADEVFDYTQSDFSATLKNYDAVFDTVGDALFHKALPILKKGGIAVSMIAQPDEKQATDLGVTVIRQLTKVTTVALDTLRKLVEARVVAPRVGKVFSLNETAEAFRARESGIIPGKVVIEVRSSL